MTDAALRAVERVYATTGDAVPLLRARRRAGLLDPPSLRLAAYLGDPAAQEVAGEYCACGLAPFDDATECLDEGPLSEWVRGLCGLDPLRAGPDPGQPCRFAATLDLSARPPFRHISPCECERRTDSLPAVLPPAYAVAYAVLSECPLCEGRLCEGRGSLSECCERPRRAVLAIRTYLLDPTIEHRIACRRAAEATASTPWIYGAAAFAGWGDTDAARLLLAGYLFDAASVELGGSRAVRDAARAVCPWLLGLGDPA